MRDDLQRLHIRWNLSRLRSTRPCNSRNRIARSLAARFGQNFWLSELLWGDLQLIRTAYSEPFVFPPTRSEDPFDAGAYGARRGQFYSISSTLPRMACLVK